MEQRSHYFFAVKLPNETKNMMKGHILALKGSLPFSRWVHHEDLHITLAFLGGAPESKLANADLLVKAALKDTKAFPLKINKLGIFGDIKSPRVFWADTMENEELQLLRGQVFSACKEASFQLESRPFRPHITLARKWVGETVFQQSQLELWNQLQPEPLSFLANEVVLYQTHLQKTPKYEAIRTYSLQT
ncbi:RNA 2',3'-cyclic phosphodiesterase [Bacillus sp. JJ1764]|uniref:RNA 2',3'-cyclic phosphodiesterase n=1 Tax=Bacillus sp. JJ1764 TaxID=3122964 RepID=UPI003000E2D5